MYVKYLFISTKNKVEIHEYTIYMTHRLPSKSKILLGLIKLILLDQNLSTTFFNPSGNGNPILLCIDYAKKINK